MDKKKVILRLEVRIISDTDKGYKTIEIPVNEAEDILALLKEQEVRVLTLDEAFDLQEKTPYPCIFVDIKGRDDVFLAYINDKLYGDYHSDDFKVYRPWLGADRKYHKTEYGKLIRFWKLYPTNKQRQAVKWDD